jgi:hypothetical protein
MGPKGRYVCTPFQTINEFETHCRDFVSIRTCLRINVYLSEDFALLVPSGFCQGDLKRPRVLLQIQVGMTVTQTRE